MQKRESKIHQSDPVWGNQERVHITLFPSFSSGLLILQISLTKGDNPGPDRREDIL